jgi:hypothetical protein
LDLRGFELKMLGDLDREAEVKGDVDPAKASKPERFAAVGTELDESPRTGSVEKRFSWASAGDGKGDGDDSLGNEDGLGLLLKIFLPFTEAKGDDADAYAMKPLCNESFI